MRLRLMCVPIYACVPVRTAPTRVTAHRTVRCFLLHSVVARSCFQLLLLLFAVAAGLFFFLCCSCLLLLLLPPMYCCCCFPLLSLSLFCAGCVAIAAAAPAAAASYAHAVMPMLPLQPLLPQLPPPLPLPLPLARFGRSASGSAAFFNNVPKPCQECTHF